MSTLHWLRRLEARVLLSVTLVVGVSLVVLLWTTRGVVTRYSLGRSTDDLRAAHAAFDRLVESRAQDAARQTALITELPTFRNALQNRAVRADAETMNAVAKDYCAKLKADFCVITDARGAWIGRTSDRPEERVPLGGVIDGARGGRSSSAAVTLSDGLFLVVAEPAAFDQNPVRPFEDRELLGTFAAAYRLDDRVAEQLALVAHCDVSFICGEGELCGSSLPLRSRMALADALHARTSPFGSLDATPRLVPIGDTSFVAGVSPLVVAGAPRGSSAGEGSGGGARLVLLQDWTPTERAVAQIHQVLVWVGLGTFFVALAGGLVFTRHMTRPLRDLAQAANDIASGNWARRVPVEGAIEGRTMAEAFNHMTGMLSLWHSEATTRAEELQESYDRFRAVTDSANDAIVSVNRRGDIVFWNHRAQAVFGYTDEEALGKPLTLLMPERYRLDYAEEMARLLSGDSRWVGGTVELSGMRRDGTEVPVELSVSSWKSGQEIFYTAVIRDITDRKQAADALRQREEQLRQAQKMEAVGRLAGGIAHDFNNLLTAILGYADLLIQELPPDQQLRKDAEEIQKAGRSAAVLTRELLAFSRKQVLKPIVLDLNSVVSATENLLRRLLGEQIDLVLDLAPDLGHVRADRGQLEQVLVNLAVNARDAMPDGGRLTIRTSLGTPDIVVAEPGAPPVSGPQALLTVTDSGEGMSEETRARIFEPFFTTKGVGKGTGLGLSTVYGIVQQSGGYIWVESALGQGASFTVALPIVTAAATADAASDEAPALTPGSELVLLVEDNDSVRSLARETLIRSGYRVLEARNGEEALNVSAPRLQDLSLLITDVVMPIMGGRELANQLAKWRPGLKVIFTSGYVTDHAQDADSAWGATFLQKPFSPATLGRTVRHVLDAPAVS